MPPPQHEPPASAYTLLLSLGQTVQLMYKSSAPVINLKLHMLFISGAAALKLRLTVQQHDWQHTGDSHFAVAT